MHILCWEAVQLVSGASVGLPLVVGAAQTLCVHPCWKSRMGLQLPALFKLRQTQKLQMESERGVCSSDPVQTGLVDLGRGRNAPNT